MIRLNWQLGAPPLLDPPDPNCALIFGAGTNVTLASGVTNAPMPPPTYQWSYYGVPLPGATNSVLKFTPIQSSNAGCYSVIVSNLFGVVTNSCCVIVNPPQLHYRASFTNTPWLLNISAVLPVGCVLQSATNLDPPIAWENLVTNTTFNCNFLFGAPMQDTNGQLLPPRFYRAREP